MQDRFHVMAALALVACGSSSSGSANGGSGGLASLGGAANSGGSAASGGAGTSGGGSGATGTAGTTGVGGSMQVGVGDPCTDDDQCPALVTPHGTCMKTWPGGGACTVVGCAGQCPDQNTWCTLDKTGEQSYCAVSCQPGIIPCTRPGYVCAHSGGCLPPDVGGVVGGDG